VNAAHSVVQLVCVTNGRQSIISLELSFYVTNIYNTEFCRLEQQTIPHMMQTARVHLSVKWLSTFKRQVTNSCRWLLIGKVNRFCTLYNKVINLSKWPKLCLEKLPFILECTAAITCWLELHGLPPELGLDPSILAKDKVPWFCIAHTDGRMVAHLQQQTQGCARDTHAVRMYLIWYFKGRTNTANADKVITKVFGSSSGREGYITYK
jgi:hypothetical protein